MNAATPVVSIILPTYNRAAFLPDAFDAIGAQEFTDWELIVVDDGSTDGTCDLIRPFLEELGPRTKFVRQSNQGAYGARNTGLDHARGRYVAFYDSDDRWLPHHLFDCVAALEANADVDWVFSACRRIEHATGRVLQENTFYYADGLPWPFLGLRYHKNGRLRIISDNAAQACMLAAGLNCGLQASVIRRRVFDKFRFQTRFRNEAEDQMAVIQALAEGRRLAYFDAVHVVYRVHSANSSATDGVNDLAKRIEVIEAESRGFEEITVRGVALSTTERVALRRRLLNQYFWTLGYSTLWQNGRHTEALAMFRRGLGHWPWSLRCWKTYALSRLRAAVKSHPAARERKKARHSGPSA